VALHRGLEELVWKNESTDAYIRDTVELVRDLDSVLTTIKDNVSRIVELLKTFEHNLMFDRKVCPGCKSVQGVHSANTWLHQRSLTSWLIFAGAPSSCG